MNKAHLPVVQSKAEWMAEAVKLFPRMPDQQREQLWLECQKTYETFYERHSNKTRYV